MLPCRMFCELKPCIGGSNEFVFESTAHPKLRIFAVLCFRFPIWLFGSGTGQLSAVNCRIWWPKLFFYIRIKLLVRSDKLGKGVTCPSVTPTRLRQSDVSYAEHCTDAHMHQTISWLYIWLLNEINCITNLNGITERCFKIVTGYREFSYILL